MKGQSISRKVVEKEVYQNAIIEIIGKINPEYLKRIYSLVIYLYLQK